VNARKLASAPAMGRLGAGTAVMMLSALVIAGCALTGSARAQAESTTAEIPPATYLDVTSDPPGVVVKLIGEYEFVGTTPWKVYRPISGIYRVEASAPGYSSWTRTVVLGPTGIQDLHVKLSRKSRFSAAARSLVFPGWGQHYNESKGKRNVVWIAETASLVALYALWERYQSKKDDFDSVAEIYRDSRNIDAIPILRRELERRDAEANDAFDNVETAQMIAIGIYGLAFLDALFSGPQQAGSPLRSRAALEENGTPGASLGWTARVEGQESRLGLQLSF